MSGNIHDKPSYRDATLNGKRLKFKSKRSKSAKERPTSFSPNGSLPKSATTISSRHLYPSKFSSLSDKSSSVFSYGDEDINKSLSRRPTTAHVRRKAYKTRLELKLTSTSEARTTYESSKSAKRRPRTGIVKRNKSPAKLAGSEDWLNSNTGKLDKERTSETLDDDDDETVCGTVSHQSHKNSKPRPKTAVGSRKKSPTKLTASEIRLESFACELEKIIHLRDILESDDSSNGTSAVSLSSSMEDVSEDDDRKPVRKTKSDRNLRLAMSKKISAEKLKPVSWVGPKITAALEEDKMFLESILKNKGRLQVVPLPSRLIRVLQTTNRWIASATLSASLLIGAKKLSDVYQLYFRAGLSRTPVEMCGS
ncbi:uncharacterized protein CEXT_6561 [Caerostris extrusa]|uniref:Uncharacterized protein n=1 Tax=Caerostris extrusa TaxID=172846 RepID=A0AAV4X8L8_CAEEX|nr:uncharacterized protein CEXT_6561 [Caerostris extrusa]